ncbi:hypothetical protein [Streptomyces sp. NPDC058583]|uniref:hypothetical protein n=1 Tax=unclassified Streptomyces TaxID=2593676 RepID=UPI00364F6464
MLRTPGEVQRDEKISELRKRLHEATERAAELQGKLDALANVTANLHHENRGLKEKLTRQRSEKVAVLPASGPWRE